MAAADLPEELQRCISQKLVEGTLLSPVEPLALLRRLIASTPLALRYPNSVSEVKAALQALVQRHPLSLSLDEAGLLNFDDANVFPPAGTRPEEQRSKRDREDEEVSTLSPVKRSKLDILLRENYIDNSKPFVEICEHSFRNACRQAQDRCNKAHFRAVVHPHTDQSLGHCSYLNTCYHPDMCRYVHFEIEDPGSVARAQAIRSEGQESMLQRSNRAHNGATAQIKRHEMVQLPAQWLDCDVRSLDMSALGKFQVVMADPPWDIHQSLPYGTMTDDEMKALQISELQDVGGLLFLWVTGRALEVGRDCLTAWGYQRIDEIIWVKTNQLQRIIRTGRTGHWLNHSKEHCLVAYKKSLGQEDPSDALRWAHRGFDCDVIVSEVRETSRKPDEVYSMIERACPGGRKLEIFGRMHNTHAGWLTLGNQLDSSRIYEKEVVDALHKSGYSRPLGLSSVPL